MAHTEHSSSERPPAERRAWGRGDRSQETGRTRWLRRVPVLGAVAVLVLGLSAGTAFAYFSATGSGSANTSVGTFKPLVLEQATAATTGRLFPTGTGALVVEVDNPNTFAVTVVGITQAGPVSVTGGGPNCTGATTGVSVSAALATGLNLAVTAGPTTTTLTVATGAAMSATSNTTCQGATFHIPVTVAAHS